MAVLREGDAIGRMVMIAGAGDAAGLRLTKDFLKAGDTVIAGLLAGQDAAALPEGMESVTIDPLSDSSAKRAAAEVAKKPPPRPLLRSCMVAMERTISLPQMPWPEREMTPEIEHPAGILI